MEVMKVIIASVFSSAVLFLIAKIIGHKQVAQLEFFDYITMSLAKQKRKN